VLLANYVYQWVNKRILVLRWLC